MIKYKFPSYLIIWRMKASDCMYFQERVDLLGLPRKCNLPTCVYVWALDQYWLILSRPSCCQQSEYILCQWSVRNVFRCIGFHFNAVRFLNVHTVLIVIASGIYICLASRLSDHFTWTSNVVKSSVTCIQKALYVLKHCTCNWTCLMSHSITHLPTVLLLYRPEEEHAHPIGPWIMHFNG